MVIPRPNHRKGAKSMRAQMMYILNSEFILAVNLDIVHTSVEIKRD